MSGGIKNITKNKPEGPAPGKGLKNCESADFSSARQGLKTCGVLVDLLYFSLPTLWLGSNFHTGFFKYLFSYRFCNKII